MKTMKHIATVLGKGQPNLTKDGRKTMCMAALEDTIGLVRYYPLNAQTNVKVWERVEVSVIKDGKDSRPESYRIDDTLCGFSRQSDAIRVIGKVKNPSDKVAILNACLLNHGEQDPIIYANSQRLSLAIVKAEGVTGYLEHNDAQRVRIEEPEYQEWLRTKDEYPFTPKLKWRSAVGKQHDSTICGQEFYEGLRRNFTTPNVVFDYARIYDQDFEKWLLIGNQKNIRMSWVVVHIHRIAKKNCMAIPGSLELTNGNKSVWPYLKNAENNARCAAQQLGLFKFTIEDTDLGVCHGITTAAN